MADEDIDVLVDYVAVVAHPDAAEAPVATGEEHAFDGSEARRRLPFVYDAREGALHVEDPVSDVCIVKPQLGDQFPPDFELVAFDGRGIPANLSTAVDRKGLQTTAYLGIRRSKTSEPVVGLGFVEYLNDRPRELIPNGAVLVDRTVGGHEAFVDLGASGKTYLLWVEHSTNAASSASSQSPAAAIDGEGLQAQGSTGSLDTADKVVTLVYASSRQEHAHSEMTASMRRFKSSRRMSDATASSTGSEEKDSSAVESTDISVHSDEEDDDDKLDQDYDSDDPDDVRDAVLIAASRARRGSVTSTGASSRRSRQRSNESVHNPGLSNVPESPVPPVSIPTTPRGSAQWQPYVDASPSGSLAEHSTPPKGSKPEDDFVVNVSPRLSSIQIFIVRHLPSRSWSFDSPSTLVDRFPTVDRRDSELPVALPMFCQPSGPRYRFIPGTAKLLTFVLTNNQGQSVHVSALQIYERVVKTDSLKTVTPRKKRPVTVTESSDDTNVMEATRNIRSGVMESSDDQQDASSSADTTGPRRSTAANLARSPSMEVADSLTTTTTTETAPRHATVDEYEEMTNKVVYVLKSIVILSEVPLYNAFFQCLIYLTGITASDQGTVPLEHYVANLFEVPKPPPGSVRLHHFIGPNRVEFWRPELQSLPQPKFPLDTIFRYLSIKNVIQIVTLLMLETKMVLFTENECVLNPIIESFADLLFPFKWPNVFIPVFPPALVDFLEAFVPYVFGMTTQTYKLFESQESIPADVCIVDLDNNRIIKSPQRAIPWLPQHQRLGERLTQHLSQQHQQQRPIAPTTSRVGEAPVTDLRQICAHGNEVQSEFLNFQFQILTKYMAYIKVPTGDIGSIMDIFDATGFVAPKSNTAKEFYNALFETQLFIKFLEDRTYNAAVDGRHVFFDAQLSAYEETQTLSSDQQQANKVGTLAARAKTRGRKTKRVYKTYLPQTGSNEPNVYSNFPLLVQSLIPPVRAPQPITVSTAPLPKRSSGAVVEDEWAPSGQILTSPAQSHTLQSMKKPGMIKRLQRLVSSTANREISKKQAAINVCEDFKLAIYNVWFRLFCAHAESAEDPKVTLRHALGVLYHLKEVEGIVPSFITYQFLLEICGKRGLADEARFVFVDMSSSGIQADAVTYGWHVQAMAGASTAGREAKAPAGGGGGEKKHSVLFEQTVEMDTLEMGLICLCRKCKHTLSEVEVMAGWNSEDDSQGTECPKCGKTAIAMIAVRRIGKNSGGPGIATTAGDNLTTVNTKSLMSTRSPERQRGHARSTSEQDAMAVFQSISAAAAAASSTMSTTTAATTAASLDAQAAWANEFVPASQNVEVPLLKPSLFLGEVQNALMARKGRVWRSKEQFVREQPTLFWNFTWYMSALNLPFETASLHHFASIAGKYIGGIEALRKKSNATPMSTKKRPLTARFGGPMRTPVKAPVTATASSANATATPVPAPPLAAHKATGPGPHFYDFNSLQPHVVSFTLKVNALSRSLQRWPRRLYIRRLDWQQARQLPRPRDDNQRLVAEVLELIDGAVAEGDMKTAVRTFLETRAKSSKREAPFTPFYQSCYAHILVAAYSQGMASKSRKRAAAVAAPSNNIANNSKPLSSSTPPPPAIQKPLPPVPVHVNKPFANEWELLDAYKAVVQQLDDLTASFTADDEAPPLLSVALRDVFRHMRI